MTVIGVGAIEADSEKIEYTVDQCMERRTDSEMNNRTGQTGTEFNELSPEAQDVFRSALQADGAYTTERHPDEFELRSDTDTTNEIQYESECYELTAQSSGGFGTGLMTFFVLMVEGGLTVLFGLGGLFSYERHRRQNSPQLQ